jgi:hypothetical protein
MGFKLLLIVYPVMAFMLSWYETESVEEACEDGIYASIMVCGIYLVFFY